MLIWDIIRDWFVQNVWGGYASNGEIYNGNLGFGYFLDSAGDLSGEPLKTGEFSFIKLGNGYLFSFGENIQDAHISFGDWLSTTSTIIVLLAVCVALYFLVRYFFRMFAGLLSGR